MTTGKKTWKIFGFELYPILWILIFLIPILWFATLLLPNMFKTETGAGVFGDMFGAVNALFSGLAFIGIIISIRMQSEELALQRNELKDTREEFKNQNFQTTFFNLLKTQRAIINEFSLELFLVNSHGSVVNTEIRGRELFRSLKEELIKIAEALDMKNYEKYDAEKFIHDFMDFERHGNMEDHNNTTNNIKEAIRPLTLHIYKINEDKFNAFKKFGDEQRVEKLQFIYERFFRKNESAIGHYFRHFYHLLRFLDKSEKEQLVGIEEGSEKATKISEEFLGYVEFIKAQVEIPELVLLFYNSLNYEKAKTLLIKYKIFDVLYVGNLIQEEHDLVPEYKLIKVKN